MKNLKFTSRNSNYSGVKYRLIVLNGDTWEETNQNKEREINKEK